MIEPGGADAPGPLCGEKEKAGEPQGLRPPAICRKFRQFRRPYAREKLTAEKSPPPVPCLFSPCWPLLFDLRPFRVVEVELCQRRAFVRNTAVSRYFALLWREAARPQRE